VLRGGIPVNVGPQSDPKIYHTFSRIHGDLERDYNNFQIDTTYFSQGPGNFRDVNQNRRNDVLFVPVIGDFNVKMFLSFVQSDGYNPLTVAGTNFRLSADDAQSVISRCALPETEADADSVSQLQSLLTSSFRIGDLYKNIKARKINLGIDRAAFLAMVMQVADQEFAGMYAPTQNGFWADHWTYTLDLVDNYLYVFPDKKEFLLYDSDPIPFFMSPAIVNDRKRRYSLCPNPDKPGTQTICAYNSVCNWGSANNCFPKERTSAMQQVFSSAEYIVDSAGAGGVWQQDASGQTVSVSVLAKFLILGSLKFSTLDPLGMGIEYEGGHPGWNDAMNGLPGLVGSGMPETFEMMRVLEFLNTSLATFGRPARVPTEFGVFLHGMSDLLADFFAEYPDGDSRASPDTKEAEFDFWNASNTIREDYRLSVVGNYIGTYEEWPSADLLIVLQRMIAKTEVGVLRSLDMTPDRDTPTYFYYQADDFYTGPNSDDVPPPIVKKPFVYARSFAVHTVPLFLEGFTRHMRILKDAADKRVIYKRTKDSDLYDIPLKMFKLTSSLKKSVQNIGRVMAFASGWLENESIWLHMSYKFYLELIRGGLYEEFFEEIKTGLVPFMDPAKYGRSPVEASSFIVPSIFPDPTLHGTGFLARLSGSTAEFLSMWALMMAGQSPFFIDETGTVNLHFQPILPSWLFTADENAVSFTFLGHTNVTYHNPDRIDTWKAAPKSASLVSDDGTVIDAPQGVFSGDHVVNLVRGQKVATIDVYF
jgi:hypothetical protein